MVIGEKQLLTQSTDAAIILPVSVGVLMAERRKPLTQTKATNCSLKIRLKWGVLTELNPGKWRISWHDSKGSRHRVQLSATSPIEAEREAEKIRQAPPGQGQKHSPKNKLKISYQDTPQILICDALVRSAECRVWTECNREHDNRLCRFFLQWTIQEGLVYWHELRFEHVEHYVKNLQTRGLALQTIQHYIKPIRRTAKWLASNWPRHYTNICENLRLSGRGSQNASYDDVAGNPVLLIHELLDFLDWLARHPVWDRLTPGVALQGLAGLQLQEALRLTWGKVDFVNETVTIEGVVKNRYRARRIPVASVVSWLLRRAYSSSEQTTDGNLIIPHYNDYRHYSHAVRKALRAWNPEVSIKPKDFRNTIQTAAIDGGWYGYYVQRYVGHAPTTIGERHYHGDQGKRLLPLFREKVITRIDAEIDSWEVPQNTPILPGPRLVKSLKTRLTS